MKTIDLRSEQYSLSEVLALAKSEAVLIHSPGGEDFLVEPADEFDKEIAALGSSERFMSLLDARSHETGDTPIGDVRKRPFSRIWTDTSDPLLKGLKERRRHIKGRCRLCKFFDGCGGSLRVRADLYFGDPWAPDPGCYLTDDEIGLDKEKQAELALKGEIFLMPD